MSETGWRNGTLGEVADLCLGKMLDQNKNRGVPTPYLANVNVRWGEFVLDDLRVMRFLITHKPPQPSTPALGRVCNSRSHWQFDLSSFSSQNAC